VGVVDHQPGVVRFSEGKQFVERGQVAVHAEDGVGDDQLAAGRAFFQQPGQRGHVVVRVAVDLGALRLGQLHRVDQRGVVELVGEHGGATAGKGRGDGDIGQVAGGKAEHPGKADEGGKGLFQVFVRLGMAADQMRGAAAGAPLSGACGQRSGEARVAGQAEVIVAGEIEQALPVDRDGAAAGRLQQAATAAQAKLVKRRQFRAQAVFQGRGRRVGR